MKVEKLKVLNDHQILIYFGNKNVRLFDTSFVYKCNKISDQLKIRWKNMINNGSFDTVEICFGDLVWPGWVEIMSDEINDLTIPFECEVNDLC